MICKKKHRSLADYASLGNCQADAKGERHKCSGCAYVHGLRDALNNEEQKTDLSALDIPMSQAKNVRHKDAKEAYKRGYEEGTRLNS